MKLTELKQSSFSNNQVHPLTSRLQERKESLEQKEKQWVQNFHMMCSKDNDRYPKTMRELFEKPLSYDVNLTRKLDIHQKFPTSIRLGTIKWNSIRIRQNPKNKQICF